MAFQMELQRLLGPLGYKRTPRRHGAVSKHPLSTLQLRTSATHCWFVRERFERFLSCNSYHFDSCALCVCVHDVVALCSCVCFYSLLYSDFDCNHLCKAWETPICGDSSQHDIDIRKTTVALKFDLWITWERLSATLGQRRSPQHGVGIGRTTVKIVVSLVHLLIAIIVFLSSLLTCIIPPKFNTHLKRAIKWSVLPSSLLSS
jgi:hypothetical protein